MKYLRDILIKLPNNLEVLILYFIESNMGKYAEGLEYLGEGMKKLPLNLKHLELHLSDNNFGRNKENMIYFTDCIS